MVLIMIEPKREHNQKKNIGKQKHGLGRMKGSYQREPWTILVDRNLGVPMHIFRDGQNSNARG